MAEEAILRETPHVDRVIDDRGAGRFDERPLPSGILIKRDDAEIDIWTKAPVETDLVLAELESQFRGGEVYEGEAHRLLQLVDIVARQANRGEMRLANLDRGRMTGEAIRFVQPVEERLFQMG